jgi:hydroxymethylglutaryl-CoA lyase
MVDRLSEVGFPVIEVTNFAHPRVIPHLKDAEEVMRSIKRRPGIVYRAQAQEILGLITCSEIYNQKNQNMTIDRGIDAAIETFEVSRRAAIPFVMAVGMAW